MKHRHVRKFSKKLVFGLLCFALSAQLVFAARLPSPVAQAVGGQASPSTPFFDLLRSAGNDLSENLSLITATINKYTPSPTSLLTRIRDNLEVVFNPSSFAPNLAQVSLVVTNPSSTPQATSTPASQPPTATSTTPLSFSYIPPAGTFTPLETGALTGRAPQTYAVSPASLASLREDLLQQIAQTRADLQANIFTSRQSSPVPGVSFAQSFQSVAPTLLSNLNNLHAGGDFSVENGNIHILSPNTGLTITSGTITISSGSASIPTLSVGTVTSNSVFTGQPVFNATTSFLGNVGIGTTQPSSTLHVLGNELVTGNFDVGRSASLYNTLYIRNDLIGYWNFNEGGGTVANDQSGNGHTGTLTNFTLSGTTSNWITGSDAKEGSALNFGTPSDYVIATLDGTQLTQLTVSLWVNPSTTAAMAFFQWAVDSTSAFPFIDLRRYPGEALSLFVDGGYVVNDIPLPTGQYTHIVVTLDTSNLWTIYINGTSAGTYQDNASHGNQSNAASVWFGNGFGGNFNGLIDEARVYDRALSAAQVANLYNAAPTSYFSFATGNSGSVGIGTSTPQSMLHLYATSSPTLTLENTSLGTGGKRLDFRLGSVASGTFDIYDFTSSTSRLTVSAYGFVGINTPFPSSTLHITGATSTLTIASTMTGGKRFDLRSGSAASGTLDIYDFASSTTRLAITKEGWIGLNTPFPSSTLHLSGANSSTISLANTLTGGKRYDFRVGAISSGTLDIYDFTSSTSRFFVGANGNIGIGTTQPSSTLHVAGALTVSSCTGCTSTSTVTAIGTVGYFPVFTATSTLSATSSLYWDSANLRIGLGTVQPSSTLHLVSTSTNQFRLGYDGSGYSTIGVASDGALTLTTNGSGANFNVNLSGSGNLNVNNGALYFNSVTKGLSVNNSASLAQFEVDVPAAAASDQIPTMTGYTTPSGIVAASSEYEGTASAWQAFDHGTGPTDAGFFGHSWGTSATTFPHWLSYQFTISKTIVKYRLYATEYPTYAPKDWTFEGWDGSSWVVLDTRINQINNWATYNEYTFTNTTAYIKYRLNISGSNSGTGYVAVDEFQMFEGTSYTPAFAVDTSGNTLVTGKLGIFTSQPSSTLHVASSTAVFSLSSTQTGGKRFDLRSGSVASGTLDIYDFASSTSRLTITQEGWVGINTPFPSSTLHVVGTSLFSATSSFQGAVSIATSSFYSATTTLIVCARSNCTIPSASTSTDTVAFFASTGGLTTDASIIARGTITGGQADIGEYIEVAGDPASYEAGDLLAVSTSSLKKFEKTSPSLDPQIAGVVTETAGFIAGGGEDNHGSIVIALAGRVPVKVSEENGPIKVGDYLTASPTLPGVAVRQLEPGISIGMALEGFTNDQSLVTSTSTSKVLVFLKTGFSLGAYAYDRDTPLPANSAGSGQARQEESALNSFARAVRHALAQLGVALRDGVATVTELFTKKLHTDVLCVGETCVDEPQLKQLLQNQNVAPVAPSPSPSIPTASEPTPVPSADSQPSSSGTTAGAAEPTVSTPPASEPSPAPASAESPPAPSAEPALAVEPAPASEEIAPAPEPAPATEPEPASAPEPVEVPTSE